MVQSAFVVSIAVVGPQELATGTPAPCWIQTRTTTVMHTSSLVWNQGGASECYMNAVFLKIFCIYQDLDDKGFFLFFLFLW